MNATDVLRMWQGVGVEMEPPRDWGWVLDLLSPVPDRRAAALSRHRALLQDASVARERMNAIWAEAGTPVPREPHLAAARDQAQAAHDAARDSTIFGPLDKFAGIVPTSPDQHQRFAPFAVLFLRWERRYPREWSEASGWGWSHWTVKELLLRRFAAGGVPIGVRVDVVELIGAAVLGPYRCKDWHYAALGRLLDGPGLRERIGRVLLDHSDPLPRLRARFLLHMMDHPEIAIRRHTWQRWAAEQRG